MRAAGRRSAYLLTSGKIASPEPVELELVKTYGTANRFDQFGRIIANAVFEDQFGLLDVLDFRGRIAVDHHEIGCFPARWRCVYAIAA